MLLLLIPAGFVLLSIVRRDAFAMRWVTGMLLAPACVMLVTLCSFAVHMHRHFDGWPRTIGERGFDAALSAHAEVALAGFGVLLLMTLACPLGCLLTAAVPRARRWLPHVAAFGAINMVAIGLTQLAPAGFLYWWWD